MPPAHGGEHGIDVAHERRCVGALQGVAARLDDHQARSPVVARQLAVAPDRLVHRRRPALRRELRETQRVARQQGRERGASRCEQQRAAFAQPFAHSLRREGARERVEAIFAGDEKPRRGGEVVRQFDAGIGAPEARRIARPVDDFARGRADLTGVIALDQDEPRVASTEGADVTRERSGAAAIGQERGHIGVEGKTADDKPEDPTTQKTDTNEATSPPKKQP